MDDTIKLTSISVILGLIAGVLSAIFSIGVLGFTNDVIGLLIGVIMIYALWKSTDKIVIGEMGRSQKTWDCFMPFFFTWCAFFALRNLYVATGTLIGASA